jgi:hypothetical protein
MLNFNPFKSLTVWGALGAVSSVLVGHFDPSALSPNAALLLTGASTLVSVLGLRNAHAKAVAQIADLVQQLAAKGK